MGTRALHPVEQLDSDFDDILTAVSELCRSSANGWVTWRQVAKRLTGTDEEEVRYSSLAALPQYHAYLARHGDIRVKLTEEGRERLASLAPAPDHKPNSPAAVAVAIRRYAGGLPRTHLRVEGVAGLTSVQGKVLQAVWVEMDDGRVTYGTPVEFRRQGSAWTKGTVVGQELDTPCLYIVFETEVTEEMLPGILALDRGFMLHELAKRLDELPDTPPLAEALFGDTERVPACTPSKDARRAVAKLAGLATPWARVLWGPPGAGKSFALAQLAAQWLRKYPAERVLLVAPTNLAVDVLLEETVAALENAGMEDLVRNRRVLRYGYARKESILSRSELLGPPEAAEQMEQIRALARGLANAERARADEREVAELRAQLLAAQADLRGHVHEHAAHAAIVATSTPLTYLPHSPLADLRWSLVAVDEAIMVPPYLCYYLSSMAEDAFLLAGDPRQLGPVVENAHRLNDGHRKWAGDDVFEATGVSGCRDGDRDIDNHHPLLVRITEQRRCVRPLWSQVRHLYPGVGCAAALSSVARRQQIDPLPGAPVVLMDTSGQSETMCRPAKRSWTNPSSASLSIELATALLGDNPDLNIGIITPFRAQLSVLNRLLRSERVAHPRPCTQIQAGTVHQFQGSAADVVIFDVVEDYARDKLTCLNRGEDGLRLANVAITRARHKLIVVANRHWHQASTRQHENPLLWKLVVERPEAETVAVFEHDDSALSECWPYESPYEALLGEAAKSVPELTDLVPQHRICREDGSLISRADFSIPVLRYAIYVDGAQWHLTSKGWHRDQRLRTELVERGWTLSVFGAHEVESACSDCVSEIIDRVRSLSRKPARAA